MEPEAGGRREELGRSLEAADGYFKPELLRRAAFSLSRGLPGLGFLLALGHQAHARPSVSELGGSLGTTHPPYFRVGKTETWREVTFSSSHS